MSVKIHLVVKEINKVYENLKKKYLPFMDTSKKETSIGGTYYGSTELRSTVGIHFENVMGYENPGNYYHLPAYYDFAFKVGGGHSKEFLKIKPKFFNEFNQKVTKILIKHGFEKEHAKYCKDIYEIRFYDEVTHGTNFSVYCGLQIFMQEKGKLLRIQKEWIQKQI